MTIAPTEGAVDSANVNPAKVVSFVLYVRPLIGTYDDDVEESSYYGAYLTQFLQKAEEFVAKGLPGIKFANQYAHVGIGEDERVAITLSASMTVPAGTTLEEAIVYWASFPGDNEEIPYDEEEAERAGNALDYELTRFLQKAVFAAGLSVRVDAECSGYRVL
jgi:hypothetical protein